MFLFCLAYFVTANQQPANRFDCDMWCTGEPDDCYGECDDCTTMYCSDAADLDQCMDDCLTGATGTGTGNDDDDDDDDYDDEEREDDPCNSCLDDCGEDDACIDTCGPDCDWDMDDTATDSPVYDDTTPMYDDTHMY